MIAHWTLFLSDNLELALDLLITDRIVTSSLSFGWTNHLLCLLSYFYNLLLKWVYYPIPFFKILFFIFIELDLIG